MKRKRVVKIERITKETNIKLELNLEGSGISDVKIGIGFLDHMLDLWTFHSLFNLKLTCKGDLEIDTHHTTEDIAIALGSALDEAVGEKKGIVRYGFSYVPMICSSLLNLATHQSIARAEIISARAIFFAKIFELARLCKVPR